MRFCNIADGSRFNMIPLTLNNVFVKYNKIPMKQLSRDHRIVSVIDECLFIANMANEKNLRTVGKILWGGKKSKLVFDFLTFCKET